MPITRYAVVKYIEDWEYPHYQTLKIFTTKEAAEKYCASLSVESIHEMLEKGQVVESQWDYKWTPLSKKLFFEKLEQRGIFPKKDFGTNEVGVEFRER